MNPARVTTFASIFHGCHRELVKFQPEVEFELVNFMELIGEAMGIRTSGRYKRLSWRKTSTAAADRCRDRRGKLDATLLMSIFGIYRWGDANAG